MINKIALSLMLSGFFITSNAQEVKPVVSVIKKVTIYQSGAQIERSASATLAAGKTTIKLSDIESSIDQNSIQASGSGTFSILAVNYKIRSTQTVGYPSEIEQLNDSIETLKFKVELANNIILALSDEKKMIVVNNKVDYAKLGFATEDLEDLSNYYRERITEILNLKSGQTRKIKSLNKQVTSLQRKTQELVRKWNNKNGELYIDIFSEKGGTAKFDIVYYTNNAGWYPTYNIKSNDISKPIDLNYNAMVYQNTGVAWDNVTLTLSTSNPRLNNNKPSIIPWRVDYMNPKTFTGYSTNGFKNTRLNMAEVSMDDDSDEVAGSAADFVKVTEQTTSIKFDISIPYTIPSDGQYQTVNIRNLQLDADFEYYTAPKLSDKAYLIAKVKNWEDKNLLPGEANIYLQNSFVGKSRINPINTSDFLELSFGVDPQVIVSRARINDYCSTSFLGNNKKELVGFQIKVRNTKSSPIKIVIEDQIPITGNEEISISIEEDSDGNLDNDTGIISWKTDISPSSTKVIELKFEAKFPKEKFVNL